MTGTASVSLMTATWSGDLDHYRLLMRSLANSPLACLEHLSVVQSEDLPAFSEFQGNGTRLLPTRQVLPDTVEKMRQNALRHRQTLGRHLTRIAGSSTRLVRWPHWPRYTGWHTQQIAKLAAAANAQTDYLLVLDSDLIVTPHANLDAELQSPEIVCYSRPQAHSAMGRKTRHWVTQAHQLLRLPQPENGQYDCYFDTPFLLHCATVRALQNWLQETYHNPWWQVLLDQSPRRWSEFATYRQFLQARSQQDAATSVRWQAPDKTHYIFDTSNTDQLVAQVSARLADPNTHFITLHSQSSGRQQWSAEHFAEHIQKLL